ncbi:MAG: hypothetical protein EOO40_02940, partial [Deltaproteobacteria bacterium]
MALIDNRIPRTINPIPQHHSHSSGLGDLADQFDDKLELPRSSNRNKKTAGANKGFSAPQQAVSQSKMAPIAQISQAAPVQQGFTVGQVSQLAPVQKAVQASQVTSTVAAPITAGGQTFTYTLPSNQVDTGGLNHVLRIPFQIGGNHHIIEAGGLGVTNAHNFTIQPEAEVLDDTYEIRLPQAVGEGRGPASVSQTPLVLSRGAVQQQAVGAKEVNLKESGLKQGAYQAQAAYPAQSAAAAQDAQQGSSNQAQG